MPKGKEEEETKAKEAKMLVANYITTCYRELSHGGTQPVLDGCLVDINSSMSSSLCGVGNGSNESLY